MLEEKEEGRRQKEEPASATVADFFLLPSSFP